VLRSRSSASSQQPSCEVSLKAVDGKYCINFYAKRDVAAGEELCYNYHSCTDVMKVWTDG